MKTNVLLYVFGISQGLFVAGGSLFAQSWVQTSAPVTNWTAIASSADGSKLVAAGGLAHPNFYPASPGSIYTSMNFGATWRETTAPVMYWTSVACSADGNTIAAAAMGVNSSSGRIAGAIFVSTNSGANWQPTSAPDADWTCIASSAAGTTLVAAGNSGILVSTNSGTTWSNTGSGSVAASSADGTRLVAGAGFIMNPILVSTNSGASWSQQAVEYVTNWTAATSSADGSVLIVSGYEGPLYLSTNSGASWAPNLPPAYSVCLSADGTKMASASFAGIYTSTNTAVTWLQANAPQGGWSSIASSADGNRLAAVMNGGGIWVSQAMPTPDLNISFSGGTILLSWTIPSMSFVLQESTDLSTDHWTDLPASPTLNLSNLQYQVSVPISGSLSFFRLKH